MDKDLMQQAHLRLEEIRARNGGRLTPDDVVADAKKKDSPLHAFPEWQGWDQKKMIHEFLLDAARKIITRITVTVTNEKLTLVAPYYIRDPAAATNQQGYTSVIDLKSSEDLAREALIAEFRRVAGMLERARSFAVVLGMQDEIDQLATNVAGVRRFLGGENSAAQ